MPVVRIRILIGTTVVRIRILIGTTVVRIRILIGTTVVRIASVDLESIPPTKLIIKRKFYLFFSMKATVAFKKQKNNIVYSSRKIHKRLQSAFKCHRLFFFSILLENKQTAAIQEVCSISRIKILTICMKVVAPRPNPGGFGPRFLVSCR